MCDTVYENPHAERINFKPQTPNFKPQTSNLQPQTSNLKPHAPTSHKIKQPQ